MTSEELLDWALECVQEAAVEKLDDASAAVLRRQYTHLARVCATGGELWKMVQPGVKKSLYDLGRVAALASGGEGINEDHIQAGIAAAKLSCPIC